MASAFGYGAPTWAPNPAASRSYQPAYQVAERKYLEGTTVPINLFPAAIPESIRAKFPNIHMVDNGSGGKIYSSSTPNADWAGFHAAIAQYTNPGGAGSQYAVAGPGAQGAAVAALAGPPDFTVTKTPKDPAITAALDAVTARNTANSGDVNKQFQDYLKEATSQASAQKAQLPKDQAALDTSGAEAELRQRNKDFTAQTADTIRRMTEASNVEATAQRAVANQAIAQGAARNSVFDSIGVASGRANAASGANTNRNMRLVSDILTPVEARIAERNYNQIGQYERPWQSQLYGNDVDTVKYIQDLKARTVGKASKLSQDYLDNLLRNVQAGQALTAGDIANVQQLSRAYQDANWYTANLPGDPSAVASTPSFSPTYPSRNYRPSGPQYSQPMSYDPRTYTGNNTLPTFANLNNRYMRDPATGQWIDTRPPVGGASAWSQEVPPGYNPQPGEYWGDYLPSVNDWPAQGFVGGGGDGRGYGGGGSW